ncbi:MAG: PDC sensor domain-containing protein [Gammaproteobacteria bacterium]|nr:PDC sensor domain-containing protein [Gammaproteobacteria bacterium]MDH5731658.1 PDC sensor domain-containing protein [Gammaproteobacteria bacterium]
MKLSNDNLRQHILHQREDLTTKLEKPIKKIAQSCAKVWFDKTALEQVLLKSLKRLPHCKFIYALDQKKIQISDNISPDRLINLDFGRDRAARPYMKQVNSDTDFLLSDAYISLRAERPSLTAIQAVHDKSDQLLGFIGADFDLRDLPITKVMYQEPRAWQQMKGDPSIRSGVFYQSRVESLLDKKITTVIGVLEELMLDHGVFHVMLHFSSSRAIVWHYDDPYRYRLLDVECLTSADTCLAFPKRKYPRKALAPAGVIPNIFEGFRRLRYMDDTLYLRTGTFNIFNGIVGLTFSCDGSHYIPYDEFLDPEHSIWNESSQSKQAG